MKFLQRHRHAILTVISCAAIILGGTALTVVGGALRTPSEAKSEAPGEAQDIPSVEVLRVEPVTVEDRLELTGSVSPWVDIILSAEIGGKIEFLGVGEGEAVRKGEVLVRIDTATLQARRDEIRAQYDLAVTELDRLERLRARGAGSEQAVDRARAERDAFEASLRSAEIQLGKSILEAPTDGVVDTLFKEADEFADAGAPLVRLVQVDRVNVELGIPERDISYFEPGDEVRLHLDALPDRSFTGTIDRIATTADAATRTFLAEVETPNPEGLIKPGMIARGVLLRKTYPESILVPMFSVISLEAGRFVYVVEEGRAAVRQVQTGLLQGSQIQVTEGLRPGDLLIVSGQRSIQPGQEVRVLEAAPNEAAPNEALS